MAPIDDALKTLEGGEHPDVPRMKLYDKQFRDHKQELTNIDVKLFSLDIVETDDLMTQHTRLSETLFNHSVRLFETHTPMRVVTTTDGDIRGARLPRLEVPTFNGNVTCFIGETSGSNSASQYTVAQVCPQQRSSSTYNKP